MQTFIIKSLNFCIWNSNSSLFLTLTFRTGPIDAKQKRNWKFQKQIEPHPCQRGLRLRSCDPNIRKFGFMSGTRCRRQISGHVSCNALLHIQCQQTRRDFCNNQPRYYSPKEFLNKEEGGFFQFRKYKTHVTAVFFSVWPQIFGDHFSDSTNYWLRGF